MDMSEPPSPAIGTRRERQPSSASRPLSQISGNNLPFSPPNRETNINWAGKPNSRPSSVAHDSTDGRAAKRASMTLDKDEKTIQTISLNLNDYASATAKQSQTQISKLEPPISVPPIRTSSLASPTPELRIAVGDAGPEQEQEQVSATSKATGQSEGSQMTEDTNEGESTLRNARDSLRPTARKTSYAEVARASPVSPVTSPVRTQSQRPWEVIPPSPSEPSSSTRPQAKSKPSWLRRTAELSSMSMSRSKSKSPISDNVSLPPVLPPRKNNSESTSRDMLPPTLPSKSSYADIAAGPSRDSSETIASTGMPPRLPSRNKIGDRIAAFSRSASSASLASQASLSSSVSHQRIPNSAQRVLGNAGSAVQKGWAGIRARGVGGSLSSISQLGQSSRRGPMDGTPRTSRERHHTAQPMLSSLPEGPHLVGAELMRTGQGRPGTVFGRPLVEAGEEAHVVDAMAGDEMERRRRHCLPAIVVRCVEYLEIWGPKEEGIFRISGRSSHIAKLKQDFDTGSDMDMRPCHPGDLDPHAVAGLFKSYLRELPSPILTSELTPLFDAYAKRKQGSIPPSVLTLAELDEHEEHQPDELDELLAQLPDANWFLLSDLVKLLDLIPRHVDTNRMTLHALMVSLGPSLKVGNGVLSELIKHRLQLFAKPPSRSNNTVAASESRVADLIDFGPVSIEPPSLASVASVPLKTEQPADITESEDGSRRKKPARLNSKPSLTKLFTSSSRNLSQFTDIRPPTPSVVDVEPPRVDLTLGQTSPLPTFGSVPSPPIIEPTPASPLPPVQTKPASDVGSEKQKLEDFQYPSGTVEARTRALSSATPIADLFQRKTPQPPLRENRDSMGSSIRTSNSVDGLRPSSGSGFRRGGQTHSVFFAGSGSGSGISPTKNMEKRNSSRSVPNTPGDKRSSTTTSSGSVKEMIKDMEKRDV